MPSSAASEDEDMTAGAAEESGEGSDTDPEEMDPEEIIDDDDEDRDGDDDDLEDVEEEEMEEEPEEDEYEEEEVEEEEEVAAEGDDDQEPRNEGSVNSLVDEDDGRFGLAPISPFSSLCREAENSGAYARLVLQQVFGAG